MRKNVETPSLYQNRIYKVNQEEAVSHGRKKN
jgi:hypothetical protein